MIPVHDGGGGPARVEPAEYDREPVEIDIDTIYGLALALHGEVGNIESAKTVVDSHFDTSTVPPGFIGPVAPGTGRPPLGSDPRYVSVQSIVEYHNNSMTQAKALMVNFHEGVRNISRITNKLVSEYASKDQLASADVDEVRAATGLDGYNSDPNPPMPYPGYGPGYY